VKVLLDTQVWIWMRTAPARLSADVRRILIAEENELLLSAATPWEIALKVAAGKLTLPCDVEEFVTTRVATTRVTPLAITYLHAIESAALPMHHRDPFDRVLIAQARIEGVPIITADSVFRSYAVKLIAASR
jgi:PIN domain nuclease of toxin-antitoxin system